jgi:hypothetical protein
MGTRLKLTGETRPSASAYARLAEQTTNDGSVFHATNTGRKTLCGRLIRGDWEGWRAEGQVAPATSVTCKACRSALALYAEMRAKRSTNA